MVLSCQIVLWVTATAYQSQQNDELLPVSVSIAHWANCHPNPLVSTAQIDVLYISLQKHTGEHRALKESTK